MEEKQTCSDPGPASGPKGSLGEPNKRVGGKGKETKGKKKKYRGKGKENNKEDKFSVLFVNVRGFKSKKTLFLKKS